MSFFFVHHGAALSMQKLQVIGNHALLTLVRYFGVRARIEKLATSHAFVIQPLDYLQYSIHYNQHQYHAKCI